MNRQETLRQRYREIRVGAHQRRLERLDRTLPAWRDRAHRRPLVVTCGATAVAGVLVTVTSGGEPSWRQLLWLGLVVLWIAQWILLRVVTRGISESSTLVLDERESALRDRATRYGFITAMTLNGAVCGALGSLGAQQVTAAHLAVVIASVTLFCGTVPVGVLAWTLPDDDPADLLDEVEEAGGAAATPRQAGSTTAVTAESAENAPTAQTVPTAEAPPQTPESTRDQNFHREASTDEAAHGVEPRVARFGDAEQRTPHDRNGGGRQ
ncbi:MULTISPECIES: hypothetical protein [Actinoalloteichus]|uniref:Uncharacterized protein n=1 Tax=Actinoalloteichus fjordicus TaxID=1612552 RepID=A0AAC9LGV0_9PSEU|nr:MULTISPECIES: hypothetical protein [Actinoalloteichus]APU17643.1 hypothetical protein UA74_28210 [Actinoalloteichus fjordicus]APU23719.1 hypothetical protein UA75_28740 [Actinoalloteichus sp. GBA129-24]